VGEAADPAREAGAFARAFKTAIADLTGL